jgi:PIN domain nuclease of toxin-antitoxin system
MLKFLAKTTELPPIYKDPHDLFIIAIALVRDLPIVTDHIWFA